MSARTVTRRHGAAWVALLGLLVQIVLSAMHVHPIAQQSDGAVAIVAADSRGVPPPQAPAAPDPDHCSACLAQHLTGHGLLPAPPDIAALQRYESEYLVRDNEAERSHPEHLLFRTRAPPIA